MQDFGKLSVLVVDDNRHMLRTVSTILKGFGVGQIRECLDAADAFTVMREFPVDIVITDWRMEPLDGLDLVRLLRTAKDSPNTFVPIIMLSAYTERSNIISARDAGVTEFLAKPVTPEALLKRMNAVIARPRPFVRAKHYFGPDRRRRTDAPPEGERRVAQASDDENLNQDEIEALMNG